jgi:hypothetical protein
MPTHSFETNLYSGRPKILFIGSGKSTHTHAWIDLLQHETFNVRLFSTEGVPPDSWWAKTYITAYPGPAIDSETRLGLFNKRRALRATERLIARVRHRSWNPEQKVLNWLAEIIDQWQPHIVHTLGLEPAGYLYTRVLKQTNSTNRSRWVAQVRGGPDLALNRLLPEYQPLIKSVFAECDRILADNQQNYDFARGMGLDEKQVSEIGSVPGTGGVDVDSLAEFSQGNPSTRQAIVWPKAYECPQSSAFPVLEAFKLLSHRLPPCDVYMFGSEQIQYAVRLWFQTLPADFRARANLVDRVPREEVLRLFGRARVMLAPALADGVPNSLYEAMATGAFPIVSPLETITNRVTAEKNVLFARNLYPEEIAAQLLRAMTDDALVDNAANENRLLVKRTADRDQIRSRVVEFYENLAQTNA